VTTAWDVAATVVDPELPMLTLADLGVLREVEVEDDGAVVVAITPTYSGCPAMATMRDDLVRRLNDEGFSDVRVRVTLHPAWTTDWITPEGRRKLREFGIAPPPGTRSAARTTAADPATRAMPIDVAGISPLRRASVDIACPRCASTRTQLVSQFGSTACKAHYRCLDCLEPFDYFKPH